MKTKIRLSFIFACAIILSACDFSKDTVDPKDYMNNNYENHEQLNIIEDKQSLLYLLKQRDTYHLLIFKKDGSSYSYEGGRESDTPFGYMKVGTPDNIHIVIFIDNSIVKAERYEFDLRASKNDKDKLTISLDGLSNLDTYLIKSYDFLPPYSSISQLRFYDKHGKRIDETVLID